MTSSRTELGRAGEGAAAAWYEDHGFEILERNWRCPIGEIDLVCRRDRLLVVCEVKARTSDRFGSPLEAVTPAKCRRLRRLAAAYLQQAGPRGVVVRFDVAAILAGQIEVVEGAF